MSAFLTYIGGKLFLMLRDRWGGGGAVRRQAAITGFV
jgi:hypothetical protein